MFSSSLPCWMDARRRTTARQWIPRLPLRFVKSGGCRDEITAGAREHASQSSLSRRLQQTFFRSNQRRRATGLRYGRTTGALDFACWITLEGLTYPTGDNGLNLVSQLRMADVDVPDERQVEQQRTQPPQVEAGGTRQQDRPDAELVHDVWVET